jgi:hypothetical protein
VSNDQVTGKEVYDCYDDRREGVVDDQGKLKTELSAWGAKLLILRDTGSD